MRNQVPHSVNEINKNAAKSTNFLENIAIMEKESSAFNCYSLKWDAVRGEGIENDWQA